jgi:hypothetical protein
MHQIYHLGQLPRSCTLFTYHLSVPQAVRNHVPQLLHVTVRGSTVRVQMLRQNLKLEASQPSLVASLLLTLHVVLLQ